MEKYPQRNNINKHVRLGAIINTISILIKTTAHMTNKVHMNNLSAFIFKSLFSNSFLIKVANSFTIG